MNMEVAERCYSMDEVRQSDTVYFVPVIRKGKRPEDDIVYRNIFCALCNGENPAEITFWEIKYEFKPKIHRCFREHGIDLRESLNFQRIIQLCDSNFKEKRVVGLSHPLMIEEEVRNIMQGPTRMGKLCFLATAQQGVRKDALALPIYVEMTVRGMRALTDPVCECSKCPNPPLEYRTTNMKVIAEIMVGRFSMLTLPHTIRSKSIFFPAVFSDKYRLSFCSMMPEGNSTSQLVVQRPQLPETQKIMWLTGSGCSILMLSVIGIRKVMHAPLSLALLGKRVQFGIIMSKLGFHAELLTAILFLSNEVACQVAAVMMHYTILIYFCHSVCFGFLVAKGFRAWNHFGRAEMVQSKRITGQEIASWLTICLGGLVAVVGLWWFDTYVDGSVIQYGRSGFCFIGGSEGWLFFIVIPVSVAVFFNLITLVYSSFHYLKVVLAARRKVNISLRLLFHFMAKMTALQMFQWICGLLFYFNRNKYVGLVLECLVAFEGIMIAICFGH